MGVGLAALKTVNIYCASFYLIRISEAENKLSREEVGVGVVGDCENKANSAQLGLAGALAELGNNTQAQTQILNQTNNPSTFKNKNVIT